MFHAKKLITLIVAISFALQGCSRGVAPTQGDFNFVDGNPDDPQIMDELCADEGGDSEPDGICDGIDENVGDADANNNGITDGDEKTWVGKNKWWLLFGTAALGTSGYVVARNKIATGKWWFKSPTAHQAGVAATNQDAGLFFIPLQDNGEVEFKNTSKADERFYQALDEDNVMTKHVLSINEVEITGNAVFNAGKIAVKKGSRLLSCFHGAAVGTAVANASQNRYHVSMYFKDKYIKVGHKIPKFVSLNGFKTFCENNTGIYVAVQTKDGVDTYNAWGAPTELFDHIIQNASQIPAGYESGVTTAYKFEQDINTYLGAHGNSLNGLKYYRHFPNHDEDKFSTVDHEFKDIVGTTTAGGSSLATFQVGIQQSTTAKKAEADLSPADIVLPDENPNGTTALINP